MIYITLAVKAPQGTEQAVKEALAMYMERYGDTKVIRIVVDNPRQEAIPGV